MALASSNPDILSLAWTTANKLETESRCAAPNLRRLVLLSNTYYECTMKAVKRPLMEDDSLLFLSEEHSYYCDDSSSSGDSDEWGYVGSSLGPEEEGGREDIPPPYSNYTSPGVAVEVREVCSSEEPGTGSSVEIASATNATLSLRESWTSSCRHTDTKGKLTPSTIAASNGPQAHFALPPGQAAEDRQRLQIGMKICCTDNGEIKHKGVRLLSILRQMFDFLGHAAV